MEARNAPVVLPSITCRNCSKVRCSLSAETGVAGRLCVKPRATSRAPDYSGSPRVGRCARRWRGAPRRCSRSVAVGVEKVDLDGAAAHVGVCGPIEADERVPLLWRRDKRRSMSQPVRHITRVWMMSMPIDSMYLSPISTAGRLR